MSARLLFLLAFFVQSGPPGSELSHNTNALAGLEQVILAVTTMDVGASGGSGVSMGRRLLTELGGSTVETLIERGVPAIRGSGREADSPVLLLDVQVLGSQLNEGQAYRPFRVSLSLIDKAIVKRTGEELRAVIWTDEVPISFAADENLVEATQAVTTDLCNRFADAYRVANGIR
jgi:hypothetical protein